MENSIFEPRVTLSGAGIYDYKLLDVEKVVELWDQGDKNKIVRDLGNLDKPKVIADLNKFISKN